MEFEPGLRAWWRPRPVMQRRLELRWRLELGRLRLALCESAKAG